MDSAKHYAKPEADQADNTCIASLARRGLAQAWSNYKFWAMQALSLSLALVILLAPGCQQAGRQVSSAMTARIPGSVPGAMSVYSR